MDPYRLVHGDCLEVMRGLDEASIDSVVCDPPYGLEFMGKQWDHGVPGVPFWTEALRVLKPGGHLLAFGGTRTYHRLACAIEDAGFEVRDCLMWLYGSGFPKSLDVSKAIDKAAGAEREIIGSKMTPDGKPYTDRRPENKDADGWDRPWKNDAEKWTAQQMLTAPATDAARQWQGWGTALKPAYEPIILARKPLVGTVAANVQEHGTGAINVDGCRIAGDVPSVPQPKLNSPTGNVYGYQTGEGRNGQMSTAPGGRWPANVALDETAAAMLDEQSGESTTPKTVTRGMSRNGSAYRIGDGSVTRGIPCFGDSGGASRFFYTSKSSSAERHYAGKNTHPTVKPVDLMRWLCRLVTPPGGLVLDPFMGSGSTGIAALAEGFRFLGIEKDEEQVATARRRIAGPLFAAEEAGA